MYVSRLRGLLVGARERMRKKFSNWRQKYKRTLLKKDMDPAAVLVAMLVFLVFGFLFGNIALCVVF